jgi:hypothetical protein
MKFCINVCLIRAFMKISVTYVNDNFLVAYIHSIVYLFLEVHKMNVLRSIDPLLSGDSVKKRPFLGNGYVNTFQRQRIHTQQSSYCSKPSVSTWFVPRSYKQWKKSVARNPCGGGFEYLHRDPASRRRRRKGKSRI